MHNISVNILSCDCTNRNPENCTNNDFKRHDIRTRYRTRMHSKYQAIYINYRCTMSNVAYVLTDKFSFRLQRPISFINEGALILRVACGVAINRIVTL